MEYIGKGGWISRIDIALDVANNTIFPLSKKWLKSLKIKSLQAERRFNRFDERMLQVTMLGSTVYFGKSRAERRKQGKRLFKSLSGFRAYF